MFIGESLNVYLINEQMRLTKNKMYWKCLSNVTSYVKSFKHHGFSKLCELTAAPCINWYVYPGKITNCVDGDSSTASKHRRLILYN